MTIRKKYKAVFDSELVKDSNESAFLARQLEHIETELYNIDYPEFQSEELFPVSTVAGPGAQQLTYRVYDRFGMAKIVSNYANDIPRVGVKAKEYTSNIRSLAASYYVSIQDVRSAAMAGMDLDRQEAEAARESIEALHDDIAFNGDADHNLPGFLSNANIPDVAIAADGTGSSALWSAKTADLILRDMNALVDKVVVDTKGVERPDTMCMPLAQYNLISTKKIDDTGKTVKLFFLENSPYIKTIVPVPKLKAAGAASSDVFFVYKKDPKKLKFHKPVPFEVFAPQPKGMGWENNCHARNGGVVVYKPLSAAKGDGI